MRNSGENSTERALRIYLSYGVKQRKNNGSWQSHGHHLFPILLLHSAILPYLPVQGLISGPVPSNFKIATDLGSTSEKYLPLGIQVRGMSPCVIRYQEAIVKECNALWTIVKRTGLSVQAVLIMPGKGTACVYKCRGGGPMPQVVEQLLGQV